MEFQELMDCYYLSEEDNNRVVYKKLLEMMKKQNVIPVIGAGLSCWAYPLWRTLLRKQAEIYGILEEVDKLLSENKYEEAASALEQEVTENGFLNNLEEIFSEEKLEENKSKMPEYLRKLLALFHGPVVTTNFDRMIEYLYRLEGLTPPDTVNPSDDFQTDKIQRMLQERSHMLVKMHGDIKDSHNMVFTEGKYDEKYGKDPQDPDLSLPMPRFLKQLLENNHLLFLGCSLEADRTCSVIKKCSENIRQFALLELPADTENAKDRCKPILKEGENQNGRRKESLRKRIGYVTGEMNVLPIWYPHGMHTEALEPFFSQLYKDIVSGGDLPPENSGSYFPLHQLFGREEQVREITEALSGTENRCVWVEGAPGIGKTETCKAVYRNVKDRYGDQVWMPFLDLTGVSALPGLWDTVANALGVKLPENTAEEAYPEYLLSQLKGMREHLRNDLIQILYFDNWEDLWYGVKKNSDEKKILLGWMKKLEIAGIRILVSTRTVVQSLLSAGDIAIRLHPLDEDRLKQDWDSEEDFEQLDSVKLFCSVLGREVVPGEREAFHELIYQLEGHPLAIVLTATQAKRQIHIKDMLGCWEKAKQESAVSGEKHESLKIALRVSWNSVKENREAVLIWGLLYYSVKDIPAAVFDRLRREIDEDKWQEGLGVLIDANLVTITSDRNRITMLLPLKKQYKEFVPETESLSRECLERWGNSIIELLDTAENRASEDRLRAHRLVLDILPQIIYIIGKIIFQKAPERLKVLLNSIIKSGANYFRNYLYSADVLKYILDFYTQCENKEGDILSILYRTYGDLLRRLGKLEEAEEQYTEAEDLYRKEKDDLGLANTLRSRGELLSRLGKLEKAEKQCVEAEELYRKKKIDLGLANTLLVRGELLSRLGKLDDAQKQYAEAEELYRKEKVDLGVANTLLLRGELLSRLGKLDEAEKQYTKAEELYRKEEDDLGFANTLLFRGELLSRFGKLDEAWKQYIEAEELYKKEKDDLGLANTLLFCGELLCRVGKLDEAENRYTEAEELYRKEKDDLGLADTLLSQGNLMRHLGKAEEAEGCYRRARGLFEKEGANLGLANMLLSCGNLLSRLGKVQEAEENYSDAERLFEKEKDDLGLANTLLSRGDLLSRIGKVEKAKEKYARAERLFEKESDELGLANMLLSSGNLLSRLGILKEAKVKYKKAEELFKREKNNLGLANTLLSCGDLLLRLGKNEEAAEKYIKAEELFEKEKDDLGFANTLLSYGDLLGRLGNEKEAEEKYAKAEELFEREKDDLGLANTLQSCGDLLSHRGEVEKAEEKYAKAEELYERENDELGLANILQSRGDLLTQLGQWEEAERWYAKAEELFKKEKSDLGLADMLFFRGKLLKTAGKMDEAAEKYRLAMTQYEKINMIEGYVSSFAELNECYRFSGEEELNKINV